jgi:anti-anti-sigma regulatory factor
VTDAQRLIIDLSAVICFDFAGLTALVDGIRLARERGGHVAVVCVADTMARYLRDAGFERTVTVSKTMRDATAVFDRTRELGEISRSRAVAQSSSGYCEARGSTESSQ